MPGPKVGITFTGSSRSAVTALDQMQAGMARTEKVGISMGTAVQRGSGVAEAGLLNLGKIGTNTSNTFTRMEAGAAAAGAELSTMGTRAEAGAAKLNAVSHSAGKAERGLLAGSGAARVFGRSLAFASNAFLGGAAIGFEVKKILDVTKAVQVARTQLRTAIENTGLSWRREGKEADAAAKRQEKLGFTYQDSTTVLARLITVTKNYHKARTDLSIAENVARARNMDLASAAAVVQKAQIGMTAGLKRMGIDVKTYTDHYDRLRQTLRHLTPDQKKFYADQIAGETKRAKALDKSETAQKAIITLQRRYAGEADRFNKTGAGAVERFKAAVDNLQLSLGKGLLPAITPLIQRAATWASKMADSGQATRKVKEFVHGLVGTLHDLRPAFHDVVGVAKDFRSVLGFIAKLVGGWPHLFEIITSLYLANKFFTLAKAIRDSRIAMIVLGNSAAPAAAKVVAAEGEMAAGMTAGAEGGVLGRLGKMQGILRWMSGRVIQVYIAYKILQGLGVHIQDSIAPSVPGSRGSPYPQGTSTNDLYQAGLAGLGWREALRTTHNAPDSGGQIRKAWERGHLLFERGHGSVYKGGLGSRIVKTARTQLGIPYHYGGEAKLGHQTDCSGLVQAVMRKNGISVPRTAAEQYRAAPVKDIPISELLPGDLVFYDSPHIGHVGIYIGNHKMIVDPHTGDHVKIESIYGPGTPSHTASYIRGKAGKGGGGGGGHPVSPVKKTFTPPNFRFVPTRQQHQIERAIGSLLHGTNLAGHARDFYNAGRRYHVDPFLLAAFAGAETHFGDAGMGRPSQGYNITGLGGAKHPMHFANYRQAIQATAKNLGGKLYAGKNLGQITAMWVQGSYNTLTASAINEFKNVAHFYDQMRRKAGGSGTSGTSSIQAVLRAMEAAQEQAILKRDAALVKAMNVPGLKKLAQHVHKLAQAVGKSDPQYHASLLAVLNRIHQQIYDVMLKKMYQRLSILAAKVQRAQRRMDREVKLQGLDAGVGTTVEQQSAAVKLAQMQAHIADLGEKELRKEQSQLEKMLRYAKAHGMKSQVAGIRKRLVNLHQSIDDAVANHVEALRQIAIAKWQPVVDKAASDLQDFMGRITDRLLQAFDQQTADYQTPAERALKMLQDRMSREDFTYSKQDALDKLRHAQMLGDPKLIREAQKELNDIVEQEKEASLQKQADTERAAWEKEREFRKEILQDELTDLDQQLQDGKISYAKWVKEVNALLKKNGLPAMNQMGHLMGKSFAEAMLYELAKMLKAFRDWIAAMKKEGGGHGGGGGGSGAWHWWLVWDDHVVWGPYPNEKLARLDLGERPPHNGKVVRSKTKPGGGGVGSGNSPTLGGGTRYGGGGGGGGKGSMGAIPHVVARGVIPQTRVGPLPAGAGFSTSAGSLLSRRELTQIVSAVAAASPGATGRTELIEVKIGDDTIAQVVRRADGSYRKLNGRSMFTVKRT